MLELGQGCNLKCVHCYNFDRARPRPARDELDAGEWRRVMAELRAEGCHQVGFTGGEPMAFPGFYDLVELAAELGMAASVVTNATLPVERLASYEHIVDVAISVYGASAAPHDAITRVPGSFERTMKAARTLRDAGTPVTLKFVAMKSNVGDLAGVQAWGFTVEVNPYLYPRHDGDTTLLDRRVEPGAVPGVESAGDLICACARSNCGITSKGDVTPCISVPMACGSVRREPFGKIWAESPQLNRIRHLRPEDFTTCFPCELRRFCRRTHGPVYSQSGTVTGYDPWACLDAAATLIPQPDK